MRTRITILAIAMLLVAGLATAAPDQPNSVVRQFSIAVTNAAQGFTIDSKVNPAGTYPVPVDHCTAWLVENDGAVNVYIRWGVMGSSTLPVATDDVANDQINQIRIKAGQSKSMDFYNNSYVSIIAEAAGPSNVRFESLCRKP